MRFMVTNEISRHGLLRTIVVCFLVYVVLLWLTNGLLYFQKMGLSYTSVVEYYLGAEERFLEPRSFQVLLEISHFHLFAMSILLVTLTHLMLFVPLRGGVKLLLVIVPFASGLADEGGGWLIRFVHPGFAYLKIAGFVLLETSLAALIIAAVWALFSGNGETYRGNGPNGAAPNGARPGKPEGPQP